MYNYIHIRDKKTKINSFEKSERKVVFMLRGLSRSYKGWLGLEDDLSEKFDVICVDLPGVGLSKNEKLLYSIKAMADKMVEVIDNLKLEEFYIVAPSLGSIVTYEIVQSIKHQRIKGLILIVPSHSGFGINRLSPRAIRTLSSASFVSKEVKIAMLKNMLIGKTIDNRDIFNDDIHLEKRWKDQLMMDLDELGTKGQLSQIAAAAKYLSKAGLDYIRDNKIPVKVLISTEDKMIPVKHEKVIYEYLKHDKSELVEMKNAGHDFIVTHREFLKELITKFIEDTDYKANNLLKVDIPVKQVSKEITNALSSITMPKKKTGILFFISTVIAGTLLMMATKKYKDKK